MCKQELKEQYAAAKALAAEASSVKGEVQAAKAELEQRRMHRSAADIASGGDGTSSKRDKSRDPGFAAELAEDSRRAEEIQTKTVQYKKAFDGLRERKQIIEALHARLEHSRNQMAVRLCALGSHPMHYALSFAPGIEQIDGKVAKPACHMPHATCLIDYMECASHARCNLFSAPEFHVVRIAKYT